MTTHDDWILIALLAALSYDTPSQSKADPDQRQDSVDYRLVSWPTAEASRARCSSTREAPFEMEPTSRINFQDLLACVESGTHQELAPLLLEARPHLCEILKYKVPALIACRNAVWSFYRRPCA